MIRYATAIRVGTASTEAILRRFTRTAGHPTYLMMFLRGDAPARLIMRTSYGRPHQRPQHVWVQPFPGQHPGGAECGMIDVRESSPLPIGMVHEPARGTGSGSPPTRRHPPIRGPGL